MMQARRGGIHRSPGSTAQTRHRLTFPGPRYQFLDLNSFPDLQTSSTAMLTCLFLFEVAAFNSPYSPEIYRSTINIPITQIGKWGTKLRLFFPKLFRHLTFSCHAEAKLIGCYILTIVPRSTPLLVGFSFPIACFLRHERLVSALLGPLTLN